MRQVAAGGPTGQCRPSPAPAFTGLLPAHPVRPGSGIAFRRTAQLSPSTPIVQWFSTLAAQENQPELFFLSLKTRPLCRPVSSECYWDPGCSLEGGGGGYFTPPSGSSVQPWPETIGSLSYTTKYVLAEQFRVGGGLRGDRK